MTIDEAAEWLARLDRESLLRILMEWHRLKQQVAAQCFCVPTGEDDWVDRTVLEANRLRECEHQLIKVIRDCEGSLAEARWRIRQTVCKNCRGRGSIGDHSCAICQGTGTRAI